VYLKTVRMMWRREHFLSTARIRTPDRPVQSLLATPTELLRLPISQGA
jgi:hypothetical protein